MKKEKFIKIYDSKDYCFGGLGCPIVEFSPDKKIIKISDPQKPENGQFIMSVKEYNNLLKNAKTIQK
ncbi:hypothetical protein A2819_02880 [Candidatus Azambacteria bacterium RIFCSPHIGHO2_01_FULL_40_24]|uniref:DUF397 domain-containing protein n=1 Tax=Candidatus Azambacteria bacterium RIFCSPHIGHO2_01_FULL_40_24 TaxID=1797301 RepID=A0A1F5B204_9BACT|nr:MAG: hypothetical protein A2819_02880 [Candidatus Azambacteria bacterium RIFCSPHIGHO2_01_FULL_40_24]